MGYGFFLFCMGCGLAGLGLVLATLYETLFADWDVVKIFTDFIRHPSRFHQVVMLDEGDAPGSQVPQLFNRVR